MGPRNGSGRPYLHRLRDIDFAVPRLGLERRCLTRRFPAGGIGIARLVRVFDTGSGRVVSTLRFPPGEGPGAPGAADLRWPVSPGPWSLSGRALLATASQDGVARLWDPASGDLVAKLEGHDAAVDFVAFDPTGSRLISGSDDGTAQIWDVRPAESLNTLEGQPQGVTSVAWSPDGKLLATASYDATVFLRDATTGRFSPG